jgi:adenylate cyclase, class 2
MAIETEVKYRLTAAQFERVGKDLAELEAEFTGEDFEENIIYGGGRLQEMNAVLRLRKIDGKTILTFKKRLPDDAGIKHQIEHETVVENAAETENIFARLGFEKQLVYEKRRKKWRFREVEVVLDELPFGLFMEIEGAFMAIKETEMRLGAEEFETEYKTYPHLTAETGKQNGNLIEARFDAHSGTEKS